MRFEIQSYILNGGRGRPKVTEEQRRCPVCGGERRDDRRHVEYQDDDGIGVRDLCRDLWHEPKVVERSAHIEMNAEMGTK
jgi:hypothetical protein